MASRIPIRRARPGTAAGPENENLSVRPSHAASRAKVLGRAGLATKTAPVAAATDATTKEREAQPSSAKRKREALREMTEARNRSRVEGVENGKGKAVEGRKIVGLPKKSTATTARVPLRTVPPADEKARQAVIVEHPAAEENVSHLRRLSSTRSLIPVLQPRVVDLDDVDEPSSKRQRTSSVGPEELDEIAAELCADDDDEEAEVEADPDGDLWDDLDADDEDPTMASEYVQDIHQYLRQAELDTMPNPRYMVSQPKLTWEMRGMLNEWLLQVHSRFRLTQETLFLTVNLIDRFLSARVISPSKIQLVGMACMLIASKFEETVSPAVVNFIQVSEGTYTAADMLQAEQHILRTLEWNLRYPSPVNFLRRISKVDDFEPQARTVAKFLAEISIIDHHFMAAPPSLIAAASMWLARLSLDHETWTPNHAHYSMYRESELIPVANHMVRYLLQPMKHEAFYKKYAGKKNMKVSVYMRHWALTRWDEGTKVDLALALGDLKREIRQQRRLRAVRKAAETEKDVHPSEDTIDLDEEEDVE
ncbi:g2/mitotic-specific cyclin cdc13 [Roridomyces roridus]|uniref:G2/mitotic-specific cyclin cdc13 n=1 Tax=Roridomyces roridus TaxID=1738132 RepID=A0AAD7C4X1_9AGAR|nr:g2/mitotic-specific cyclin cdc13 [Roridomyces roridus]